MWISTLPLFPLLSIRVIMCPLDIQGMEASYANLMGHCALLLIKHGTLYIFENPVKVISERLGHSNIKVTLDINSHVLPTMQEEALRKLNEILM